MPGGPSWPRGWEGERGKEPSKIGQVARIGFWFTWVPSVSAIPGPLCRLVTVLHRVRRGTQVPVGGQSIPPSPHLGDLERMLTAEPGREPPELVFLPCWLSY